MHKTNIFYNKTIILVRFLDSVFFVYGGTYFDTAS